MLELVIVVVRALTLALRGHRELAFDNIHWADHRDSGSRRPSSPLRTAGSVGAGLASACLLELSAV
ncbi:MAG: hypothetical protein DMF92_09125 [Acidobacteria bacterium]|nr:MAG: hypothetical protein DMF92_09125 [Acidobacteriota bacterium]